MDKQTNTSLPWLIVGGLLIILTGLIIMFASKEGATNITDSSVIRTNDQVKGNLAAENILIEYSDFQCPACATYQAMIKKFAEDFSDQVKIVYRHFPLESIHPHARFAAQAAESAAMQNKFWEMHDKLFENQADWSTIENPQEKFEQYANELNLDIEKFKNDLNSSEIKNKIDEDLLLAETLKLNSTPTFFLNGKQIKFNSYNQLRNALNPNQN